MEKQKSSFQQIDFGLLFLVFILSMFSLIAVYSATHYHPDAQYFYFLRQGMWYAVGFAVLLGCLFFDYRRLKDFAVGLYILGIFLLIWVVVDGVNVGGSQRWIEYAGFRIQPSEFVKIFLVIMIAHLLAKAQIQREENPDYRIFKDDLSLTFKIGIVAIIPFFFIVRQPDLGTSLVLVAIVAIMLLGAGISWRVIFLMIFTMTSAIVSLIILYFVNSEVFNKIIGTYQLNRIYGWLDPTGSPGDFGFQLIQSMLAIGSGQLMGRGFQEGAQSQGGYIPELHTDFIFAVIGEEFGFIGASILISVYFILIYRLVQIALTCNDTFGTYLVVGVIGMIVFQVYQNIGMTIGLMPITGLALPFISYGGSALLTNMIAIGIVLNVHMRTKVYMFD